MVYNKMTGWEEKNSEVELSSSSGSIGFISKNDSHDIKKSVYDSNSESERNNPAVEEPKQLAPTNRVREVSTAILTSSTLHVDASEFKPRARSRTQPLSASRPWRSAYMNRPLSWSLPSGSGYMDQNKSYMRTREQRGGMQWREGRNAPRFYSPIVRYEDFGKAEDEKNRNEIGCINQLLSQVEVKCDTTQEEDKPSSKSTKTSDEKRKSVSDEKRKSYRDGKRKWYGENRRKSGGGEDKKKNDEAKGEWKSTEPNQKHDNRRQGRGGKEVYNRRNREDKSKDKYYDGKQDDTRKYRYYRNKNNRPREEKVNNDMQREERQHRDNKSKGDRAKDDHSPRDDKNRDNKRRDERRRDDRNRDDRYMDDGHHDERHKDDRYRSKDNRTTRQKEGNHPKQQRHNKGDTSNAYKSPLICKVDANVKQGKQPASKVEEYVAEKTEKKATETNHKQTLEGEEKKDNTISREGDTALPDEVELSVVDSEKQTVNEAWPQDEAVFEEVLVAELPSASDGDINANS